METTTNSAPKKLSKKGKMFIIIIGILIISGLFAVFSPEVKTYLSKSVSSISVDKDLVNNTMTSAKIPFPSEKLTANPTPKVRFLGYMWNGATAWNASNGGPLTTKGSLMEGAGVNLELVRQDNFDKIRDGILLGLKEFNAGQNFPTTGYSGAWFMGDGGAYFVSTTQPMIDKIYGKGKYHVQVNCASGLSCGEDKVIGSAAMKLNPQLLKGAVMSAVIGDGDWVIAVNYCGQLGIPVNPDPTTYDPNACNFVQAEESDYIKAAQMLIKSQKTGWTVPLKLMQNGKRTNTVVNKKIDCTTTWFPGDKMVYDELPGYVDIISTKEYNNQMACVLVTITEWSQQNSTLYQNMLKAMCTAGNQIKLYDDWLKYGCACNAKTFKFQDANYWYKAFKGYVWTDVTGSTGDLPRNVGGTRAFNYADNEQYFGLNGPSRYELIYTKVASYLDDLNPMGYKENVERTIPYSEAVNFTSLQSIKSTLNTGSAYQANYSSNTGQVVAKANYHITFKTGSDVIEPDGLQVIKSIYGALSFSEDMKVSVIGHTDNIGNPQSNLDLSKRRAQSVLRALISLGASKNRFDTVDGMGDTSPISGNTNSNETERSANRRVEISLLK